MTSTVARIGLAGLVLGAALTGAASPAQAAVRDGRCDAGEFCLYFNSGQQGAVSDFTNAVSDYGTKQPECFEFKGTGAGAGTCVKNAAASVWNRTRGPVTVYYNSGHEGASQTIAAGGRVNLSAALKNQNASHRLGKGGPARTALSNGLYKSSGGRVTAGFDGYRRTPGRHEGIDVARSIGSPVHALMEGRVLNVSPGRRGRSSGSDTSTLAIYSDVLKKTVIYLHTAPSPGLRVGQRISKGQRVGTEDYRGVSSSGAAHTHVEVRNGAQRLAAKSVGDETLTNPDPTEFWASLGFRIA
jgi:murein DD-endopeptidase MepM/ murein hydrolase activator NlpD